MEKGHSNKKQGWRRDIPTRSRDGEGTFQQGARDGQETF